MTEDHFGYEMERLIKVYGQKAYPKERAQLFWNRVSDLPDVWMTEAVDYFIAYETHPPMMPQWEERAAIARERKWSEEKRIHRRETEEFVGTYPPEDIQTICSQIRLRLQNRMSDSDFNSFKKMVSPPPSLAIKRCNRCSGEGFYFDGGGYTVCCVRNP